MHIEFQKKTKNEDFDMQNYRIPDFNKNRRYNNFYAVSSANAKKPMYSASYARTNAYRTGYRSASSQSFMYLLFKMLEKLLLSDGFAAGFCGVSFILVIGIVGGIECGRLSLASGVAFSSILLAAVSILLYKKNKE